MTPADRASLAEQILTNPLFAVVMAELETSAIERMVSANTDLMRHEAQLRIQAVRSFRSDCEACLRSTRERKAAPA
jgi:diacylglycerol kinase